MSIKGYEFNRIPEEELEDRLFRTGRFSVERSFGTDLCYIYARFVGGVLQLWEHRPLSDRWTQLGSVDWQLEQGYAAYNRVDWYIQGERTWSIDDTFYTPAMRYYAVATQRTWNYTGYSFTSGTTAGPITRGGWSRNRGAYAYGENGAIQYAFLDYNYRYSIGQYYQFTTHNPPRFVGSSTFESRSPRFWTTEIAQLSGSRNIEAIDGSGYNLVFIPRVSGEDRGISVSLLSGFATPTSSGTTFDDGTGVFVWYDETLTTGNYEVSRNEATGRIGDEYALTPGASPPPEISLDYEESAGFSDLIGSPWPRWMQGLEQLDRSFYVHDVSTQREGWTDIDQDFVVPFGMAELLAGSAVVEAAYVPVSGSASQPEGPTGLEDLPSICHRGLTVGATGPMGRIVFEHDGDRFAATHHHDSYDPDRCWFANGYGALKDQARQVRLAVVDSGTLPESLIAAIEARNADGPWCQFGHPDWEMDGSWWPVASVYW